MRSLLCKLEKLTCTCTLTHSGAFLFLFSCGESPFSFGLNASVVPFKQYLLFDFRATNHMTLLSTHFSTYSPYPSNKKNPTRDGTLITVEGQGRIQINSSMTHNNVLHIPKLSTSLISIQKITKDLSCNNIFYNKSSIFQDMNSRKTIGSSREWDGLYLLNNKDSSLNFLRNNSYFLESIMTNKEKVLLYHFCLLHPLFRFIKPLFLALFKILDVESLHCEMCEFAKHKVCTFFRQ